MKKVLALLSAALLFLTLFGCDLGNLGGDPVNPVDPVVPSDPLAVGSIVLTLTDPGVVPEYNDVISPRAVITGAASNGCTFSTEVFFDETTKTVTINNLLAGTWNIKVKVWDDLRETDNYQFVYDEEGNIVQGADSGKLEDVVALGYETALIVTDEETALAVDLWTQDEMHALLDGAVYDTGIDLYDNSSGTLLDTYYLPEDTETYTPRAALTWGVYALMAYDEEIVLDIIENLDPNNPEDMAEMEAALELLGLLSDSPKMAGFVTEMLGEDGFWDGGITFVYMVNFLLDPLDEKADLSENDFLNIIIKMYQTVDEQVVGDYEFLYYDFIDLEISGMASDYDGSASVDLTVAPVYGSSLGAYTWYLNGAVIGTGTAFTLDPESGEYEFLDGVNYLSVQYKYGTVILGTDEVWFSTKSSGDRILLIDVDFSEFDSRLYDAIVEECSNNDWYGMGNLESVYADQVTILYITLEESAELIDLTGLDFLVNLENLVIQKYVGILTLDNVQPILAISNLQGLYLMYIGEYPLTMEAESAILNNFPSTFILYIDQYASS